jgi:hypothetical protein
MLRKGDGKFKATLATQQNPVSNNVVVGMLA